MSGLARYRWQLAWLLLDLLLFVLVALCTVLILGRVPPLGAIAVLVVIAAVRVWFFIHAGMYRAVIRYSDVHTLVNLAAGVVVGSVVGSLFGFFFQLEATLEVGRAFWILEALLALAAVGGSRFAVRYRHEVGSRTQGEKLLIYGAGLTGATTAAALMRGEEYRVVGFLDDDPDRSRALLRGVRVLGRIEDLERVTRETGAAAVIVAFDLEPDRLRQLFRRAMELGLRIKVVRGVDKQLGSEARVELADLALEDLLRRPPRHLDEAPVRALLAGRRVLVTGGGGSIGRDLCLQIAAHGAGRLVVLDHSEADLYRSELELRERFPDCTVVPVLLSMRDAAGLDACLAQERPELVFHAAAYKHVPLVEANPLQGVRNNVEAFRNLVRSGNRHGVERLVLISTDKVVRPTNVMGASKRVCELLLQEVASPMVACAVRFGNVLGSSGSVVPLFLRQIAAGGPVTVTDPAVTRYFMLIPEAVELVLQAAALAEGGEIFLLDMGEPVKIDHLARQLIYMTGNVPDKTVTIRYTGLRPGEKRYEELLSDGSDVETPVPGLMRSRGESLAAGGHVDDVDGLLAACREGDTARLRSALARLVPSWSGAGLGQEAVAPGAAADHGDGQGE